MNAVARTRGLSFWELFLVVVIAGLAIAALAALASPKVSEPAVAYPPPSPTAVVDCAYSGTWMALEAEAPGPLPVRVWVNRSSDVAEVEVSEVGDAIFNTPNGLPPTPPPEDEDEDGADIFRPTVMDVRTLYQGDETLDGYVVAQWGGSSPLCPDYVFERRPPMVSAEEGDRGVVFLSDPPAEWQSDPPVWFEHLLNLANSLPGDYAVKLPRNWYRFVGQDAISTWTAETIPISQLVQDIMDAL